MNYAHVEAEKSSKNAAAGRAYMTDIEIGNILLKIQKKSTLYHKLGNGWHDGMSADEILEKLK